MVAAALAAIGTPAPGASGSDPAGSEPSQRRGALVDRVVFTEESNPGKVVGQIETGARHVLAQGITNAVIHRQLLNARQVTFAVSYGSSAELTLNPAGPALADGSLNPFGVPAIREALNWLVDRQYIASELYGGLAEPRYLPLSTAFPDYARLAATARKLELAYSYQPERARRIITREMNALGARLRDGRWHYDGEPVRLKLLIRTEDARRQVGDYVANRLEAVDFAVDRLYRTADQAAPIWLASDPAAGKWHLYTGGWVSTVINRDQAQNFADFYTPRGRPSPLWQAYEPSDELDEIAQRLERRDYDSSAQRRELMIRALTLAMENSVRVWLVDQLNLWPHAANVELAVDLAGGVAGSRLWPYTLRFTDRVGGEVIVSSPSVLTDPWNPVAGTNWLYDQMMIRALQDAAVLPDPFTGLYWPQRLAGAEVTIVEDTPVQRTHDWLTLDRQAEITVPPDTWIAWDAGAGRFVTVGERYPEGLTARTRTRLRFEQGYLDRRWHDGTRMSLADMVLPWILEFARADEASALIDRSHVPTHETFREHFRGWRIVSREPLVVDVYSDQIYPDAETIVAARTPVVLPWHVLALGIRAETSGELAFSSDKADRRSVPWLSLVSGPSLPVLDRHREGALADGYVPFRRTLAEYVGESAPARRYRALGEWRAERDHYWVGDGPFYLESVHPVAGTLVLARFPDFPDRSDKWLRFTSVPIPEPAVDGPITVALDESARFRLSITSGGDPYPPEAIRTVSYLLFDGAGVLSHQGTAEPTDGGWRITLPRDRIETLGAGANRLEVTVRSDRVALPRFATHVFATIPADGELPQ
ncbi:ABC transporter substrate-binding protein [Arhodomonas sp. AD133]|uniref:ABC transporter substrate-binding protein n=1 Tax=Arhodomonas sp. AD133 TaxID=3415009 RepID=UPI003EBBC38E